MFVYKRDGDRNVGNRRTAMNIKSVLMRRVISVILSAALVIPAVFSFPAGSYAAVRSGDTETVKSAAYNVIGRVTHYYSDDFFRGDSEPYNASLANLSYLVCNLSYSSHGGTHEPCRDLREFLQDNGFADFDYNDDYAKEASIETSAVACAHKKIVDNGKTYTLLAVIPRSGTFGAEFERSLILSKSGNDIGDHAGYVACKDKVVDYVREYIKDYGIKGNIKVWTTGYSGGGGVSNLFAAELIKYPAYVLGNPNFKASDLYNYNFSPMRAASLESDPRNSRYDCLHNVLDDADLLMKLPTADCFDRYGKVYRFREHADKDRMIELMSIISPSRASKYVEKEDPDLFMTYKLDAEALIKSGKLVTIPDPDSYLAKHGDPDLAYYFDGVEEEIAQICRQADDGKVKNSRNGFYQEYQPYMMDLVGFFFRTGINYGGIGVLMDALMNEKTSIPLILSMYTSFLVNKSINERNADLDSLIEESFNRLASQIENEDGTLKAGYEEFSAYVDIRDKYFTESNGDTDGKYSLTVPLAGSGSDLLIDNLKKLTGALYAESFREALQKAGTDEDTIAKLTSKEASEASAWFIMGIIFGNGLQSDKIEPFSPDNEQFCQTATFVGNIDTYMSMHMFYYLIFWYMAGDENYDDFCKCTDAQNAGYRRVFVTQPSGTSVSGTVQDGSGRTLASFRDGKLESRTDEWIGMTTADSGSWLRLPLDQSYKVVMKLDRDADVNLRVADYSINDGAEVRSGNRRKWEGISAKASDTLTLDIPAVKKDGDSYDMAGAVYTLDITKDKAPSDQGGGSASGDASGNSGNAVDNAVVPAAGEIAVYSGSVPAPKGVSVSAGRGSVTVKWKKLSSKKLKKFTHVQIQYSTDKQFSDAKDIFKSKSRTSFTKKKLGKGTYYVRVRNVKKSGGIMYVSGWSRTKKAKVK